MLQIQFFLLIFVVIMGHTRDCPKNQDVLEYFKKEIPDLGEDLSKITWHHAVNTEELLIEALSSDKDMVESDIVHVVRDGRVVAVMGHNPEDADGYNFSLERFLQIFNAYSDEKLKGLKLDFKTTEAFEAAMDLNTLNQSLFPVWINADILQGPGGAEAKVRINYSKYKLQLDCHILSIGWTTGKVNNGSYSREQIEEMKSKRFGLQGRTYPIRAAYLPNSWKDFEEVLLSGNEDTLTVWSPEFDADIIVAADLKKVLVENKGRIFLDVPDNIIKILDDVPNNQGGSVKPIVFIVSVIVTFVISSLL